MSRKAWINLGFFTVLALLFYFVMAWVIPGYTKKKVAPVSFVRPFRFIDQDGRPVTDSDLKGTVYVAGYFFTSCKGICPKMNNHIRLVYDALRTEPDFRILAHTCDPETDSVPVLRRFADSMQVDTRKWTFLTGRKDSLYQTARISYTIDDPANNLKSLQDDFLHTQFWALIDRNGDVRKVYDGLRESEVKKMIRDARKLLKETPDP